MFIHPLLVLSAIDVSLLLGGESSIKVQVPSRLVPLLVGHERILK